MQVSSLDPVHMGSITHESAVALAAPPRKESGSEPCRPGAARRFRTQLCRRCQRPPILILPKLPRRRRFTDGAMVLGREFPGGAVDIAQHFRAADIPVSIGGFPVSGSLASILDVRPGLQNAWSLGVLSPLCSWEGDSKTMKLIALAWRVYRCYRRGQGDTNKDSYQDLALKPVEAIASSLGRNLDALDRAAC